MNTRTLVILAFSLAVITAGLIVFFTPQPAAIPSGARTIPYLFMVGENPGIDAGTDIFRLGQVTPGGTSWRTLAITPTLSSLTQDNRTVRRAKVWASGSGAEWLVIEPPLVDLPGEVKISLHASPTAKPGQYRGVIVVEQLPAE